MLQDNLWREEADLLGRAGQDGFEEMYRTYRRRIRGLCRARLQGSAEAEDASQEVMLRAFRAWPRFEYGQPVWPWLSTIAANVCCDARRRSRTRARANPPLDPVPVGVEEDGRTVALAPDAYEAVARNTRTDLVRDALEAVPTAYRASLYLREIEGWSLSDIALARGRSRASVRSTLTRGRRILAAEVEALARARRQWPLPAVVLGGLSARVRSRLTKMREAINDASIAGWVRMDAVVSIVASARVGVMAPVIAAAAGLVVLAAPPTLGAGASVSADRNPSGATRSTSPDPASVALVEPPSPAPAASPARTRPQVTLEEAHLPNRESTWTATPAVEAAPGPLPVEEEATPQQIYVGPATVNCGEPHERGQVMEITCTALGTVGATR